MRALDIRTNIKISLFEAPAGEPIVLPVGKVTRLSGFAVLPANLALAPAAQLELAIVSDQSIGAVSMSVATKVLDLAGGEYSAGLLVADTIKDLSVPTASNTIIKAVFTGGDLANVANGKIVRVEITRFGGVRRSDREARAQLLAAYLSVLTVDLNTGGGVTDHGALTGLADDDHTQYALANGARGNFEAAGAVAAHVALGDPHVQYVLRSILTTRGDLFVRAASVIARLALGANKSFLRSDGTDALWSTLLLPNAATVNRIPYAIGANEWGESADLEFDGNDLKLGSGIRARMAGQNRFRYLNSLATATHSANQSCTTATVTVLTWNTNGIATDGIHSTVTNPTRFTAALTGKYLIGGVLSYASNATGGRYFGYRINGGGVNFFITGMPAQSTSTTLAGNTIPVSLSAGDYIEFLAFQDSGGNLNVTSTDTKVFIAYVGE